MCAGCDKFEPWAALIGKIHCMFNLLHFTYLKLLVGAMGGIGYIIVNKLMLRLVN